MTTKNQSAFLICPTSRTTHLGGTPLESGEAGGHIRKTMWVSAIDAALDGLGAAIRGDQVMVHALSPRVSLGAAGAVLAPEHVNVNGHDVRHGNAAANMARFFNDEPALKELADGPLAGFVGLPLYPPLKRQQALLGLREAGEVVVHGSYPLLLCGLSICVVHQWAASTVRPAFILYAVPEPHFGKQHLTGQHGAAFTLKCDGKLFRARAGAIGHVLQVATGRINLQGESFALFNAQALPISFEVHG